MDTRTNGPVVYENMETSIEGVFAAGNVVHVHDLVDYVSMESEKAGIGAAEYILYGEALKKKVLKTSPGKDVSYVVPQLIRKDNVTNNVELSFRVRSVKQDVQILVKEKEKVIARFKREHIAPSEMEKVVLPKVLLEKADEEITVSIEEKL